MSAQLFPLDVLRDWNRLYGPGGLIQYQFAVPDSAAELVRAVPELLRRRASRCTWRSQALRGALGGPALVPAAGWTVAIDLPGDAPELARSLAEADELVASGGGRSTWPRTRE